MVRSTMLLLAALWQVSSADPAVRCKADDCARAVSGTFRSQTSTHYADCASFQQCTVTPPTSTQTSTVTVTPALLYSTVIVTTVAYTSTVQTATVPAETTLVSSAYPVFKRDVAPLEHWLNPPQSVIQAIKAAADPSTNCPTATPAYASACSGTVKYASACSCWGRSKSYTTVPTPTTTVTTTTTLETPITTVPATSTTEVDVVATTTYGTLTYETDYPTCTASPKQATGPDYCECKYTESCGKFSGSTCNWPKPGATYYDCLTQCDHYVDCVGFNFDYKSSVCTLCDRHPGNASVTDDGMTAAGVRNMVACGGTGGYQCYSD